MKKILIIAKLIYPYQSPRSFRATELGLELAKQGNQVIIYALLGNFNYNILEKNHNIKIKNLGKTYFVDKNSDGIIKRSFFINKTNDLLDKWTEIKNIELAFKVNKILNREKLIDIVITIGGPYTLHWGVSLYKGLNNGCVPWTWISDCGDPFMGNRIFRHPWYFKFIEKWSFKSTDYITIPIEEAKKAYYKEFHHKIKIIPQGFNIDNISKYATFRKNKKPTFVYAGTFYKTHRDPTKFMEYISTLKTDFIFIIFTKTPNLVLPYKDKLKEKLIINKYIHREMLLNVLKEADFVINFENDNSIHYPSKIIDYLIVNKPILSINCKNFNLKVINEFLTGNYTNRMEMEDIEKYNIKNIASSFLKLGGNFTPQ